MNKEIEIPEGYEARIDENKVIIEIKQSEDERIRNEILVYIGARQDIDLETHNRWCAYLERQKDKVVEFDHDKEQNHNPYTGTGFDYNGHHWCMCARDGGVEILVDGTLKGVVFSDSTPNVIGQNNGNSGIFWKKYDEYFEDESGIPALLKSQALICRNGRYSLGFDVISGDEYILLKDIEATITHKPAEKQ